MKLLNSIGYSRDNTYITSVVRQRPYSIKQVRDKKTGELVEKRPNRTPTKKEVLAFAPLFDWELATVAPRIIVPLGNTALQRLLGPTANIGELHGQSWCGRFSRRLRTARATSGRLTITP